MTKKHIYIYIIIGAIIAALVFLYYDGYFHTGEPPLLLADTSPTRVKPDEPGGMLDGYNSIYDQIKSQSHNTRSVTLVPEPEEPLSITPPQDASEVDIISSIVSGIVETPNPPLDEVATTPDPNNGLNIITVPEDHNVKIPTAKKTKIAYYVQVASTKTKAHASKEFHRITKSYGQLLSNIDYKIERYEIANKGAYYRLLLGPLSGVAKAKLICKKLASAKQTCIIKKM